jgi:hypothetical protein
MLHRWISEAHFVFHPVEVMISTGNVVVIVLQFVIVWNGHTSGEVLPAVLWYDL